MSDEIGLKHDIISLEINILTSFVMLSSQMDRGDVQSEGCNTLAGMTPKGSMRDAVHLYSS